MFAAIRVWLSTLFKPLEAKLKARIELAHQKLDDLERKLEDHLRAKS